MKIVEMDSSLKLHTAARRFCIEQHKYWWNLYRSSEQQYRSASDKMKWEYTEEAYKIFPRYLLAEETLNSLERAYPDARASFSQMTRVVSQAGDLALRKLESALRGSEQLPALRAQAASFANFVSDAANLCLGQVDPLPYRRVLTGSEGDYLWSLLSERWKIESFTWFPLSGKAPVGVLTFHEDLWKIRSGNLLIIDFLKRTEVARPFLLLEYGVPGYELDLELVNPSYDGTESYLLTDGSWTLFTSHESSRTLVGQLADFFREQWRDADSLSYRGPFATEDKRGTWGPLAKNNS